MINSTNIVLIQFPLYLTFSFRSGLKCSIRRHLFFSVNHVVRPFPQRWRFQGKSRWKLLQSQHNGLRKGEMNSQGSAPNDVWGQPCFGRVFLFQTPSGCVPNQPMGGLDHSHTVCRCLLGVGLEKNCCWLVILEPVSR